jgi:hypothetical protein
LNEAEDPTINCLGCPRIYTIVGLDEVASGVPTGIIEFNWFGDNSRLLTSLRDFLPPIGGIVVMKAGGPSIYIGHCNGAFNVPCVVGAKIRMAGYSDVCVSVYQVGAPALSTGDTFTLDSCGTRSPVSGFIELPNPGEFPITFHPGSDPPYSPDPGDITFEHGWLPWICDPCADCSCP